MGLFGHKKETRVMLSYDVITKCKCATCSVQVESVCAKPKIIARNEMLRNPKMSQFMSPGMMENVEMMKNMNLGTIRNMSREEMKNMSDQMMKNMPKEQIEAMAPKIEDIPGPYCANGVAFCKDLDFSKMCICGSCQVFRDFNLNKSKPMNYFCRDGKPR